MMDEFHEIFDELKSRCHNKFKSTMPAIIIVRNCPKASTEHKFESRVYSFQEENLLHFCRQFEELPWKNKFGIMAHEIGHYIEFMDSLAKNKEPKIDVEILADWYAEKYLGTRIYYDKDKVQFAE